MLPRAEAGAETIGTLIATTKPDDPALIKPPFIYCSVGKPEPLNSLV